MQGLDNIVNRNGKIVNCSVPKSRYNETIISRLPQKQGGFIMKGKKVLALLTCTALLAGSLTACGNAHHKGNDDLEHLH